MVFCLGLRVKGVVEDGILSRFEGLQCSRRWYSV
jgi:hypothetical protein